MSSCEFSTLLEFLLHHKVSDMNLLSNPVCCNILLQRRQIPPRLPSDDTFCFISKHWNSFKKTDFYVKSLFNLPIKILQRLSEFDIYVKTVSKCLIRLNEPILTKNDFDFMSRKSLLIRHINLLSNQDTNVNMTSGCSGIGGQYHKLSRLDGVKQEQHLLHILSFCKESIVEDSEKRALTEIFVQLSKNFRKLNQFSILPEEVQQISTEDSKSTDELISKCRVNCKTVCNFLSKLIIVLVPFNLVFGKCKLRRIFIKELMKLIRNSLSFNRNFLHELHSIQANSSGPNSLLYNFKNNPNVIANVLYLIITDFIFPILKQHFYIYKDKLGIAFLIKPLWRQLQKLAFNDCSNNFTRVEEIVLQKLQLSNQLFGLYSIRFQPKCRIKSGVRLISMLNKIIPCDIKADLPVNAKLVPTAAILKTVHRQSSFETPYPIKGKIDLSKTIAAYKKQISKKHGEIPYIWFFVGDAMNCYDNINLNVLSKEVLPWMQWSPFYHVFKIKIFSHSTHCSRTRNIAISSNKSDRLSFDDIINEIGSTFKNCTAVLLKYSVYTKAFAQRNVRNFLFNSFLWHKSKYYRRNRGIPQGAKISKHLCDFYFCFLFRNLNLSVDTLFLSATDDFLLLSIFQAEVDSFMNNCYTGNYDFVLNKKKVFSYLGDSRSITYFGVEIDTGNLNTQLK